MVSSLTNGCISPSLLYGSCISSLADRGLANLLGLETLRHGTNIINYLSIKILGGDPSHGAKKTGSTEGWLQDDTNNFFYVFKDSELYGELSGSKAKDLLRLTVATFFKAINPRRHAFLSGYNLAYYSDLINENFNEEIISAISGLANAIISPTLNFRFTSIDSNRFEDDPLYEGTAYRTQEKIEPWRIGFLGSLVTGVNWEWFRRAKENPYKIMTGIAQLTAAVALTVFTASTLLESPGLAIAGALLA